MVEIDGTTFAISGRRFSGLGVDRIQRNLPKIWRNFQELPRERIKTAWIVDVDAPLGGGPLGAYSVGLYYATAIDQELQAYIQKTTLWDRLPSTQAYIDRYYRSFSDPTQAYVDDMLTHELGHLFFGFGLTSESNDLFHKSWFSLGMGMLYDRVAWRRCESQDSPLFSAIIELYQKKYAVMSDVDQRLIDPETARDSQFDLARAQVFAHGKAYVFLATLRDEMSSEIFDKIVVRYLGRPSGSIGSYDEFSKVIPPDLMGVVKRIEAEFGVRHSV